MPHCNGMQDQTASSLYAGRQAKIFELLSELGARLENHATRQARDQKNYGFVGDLGSVVEALEEVLTRLTYQ